MTLQTHSKVKNDAGNLDEGFSSIVERRVEQRQVCAEQWEVTDGDYLEWQLRDGVRYPSSPVQLFLLSLSTLCDFTSLPTLNGYQWNINEKDFTLPHSFVYTPITFCLSELQLSQLLSQGQYKVKECTVKLMVTVQVTTGWSWSGLHEYFIKHFSSNLQPEALCILGNELFILHYNN